MSKRGSDAGLPLPKRKVIATWRGMRAGKGPVKKPPSSKGPSKGPPSSKPAVPKSKKSRKGSGAAPAAAAVGGAAAAAAVASAADETPAAAAADPTVDEPKEDSPPPASAAEQTPDAGDGDAVDADVKADDADDSAAPAAAAAGAGAAAVAGGAAVAAAATSDDDPPPSAKEKDDIPPASANVEEDAKQEGADPKSDADADVDADADANADADADVDADVDADADADADGDKAAVAAGAGAAAAAVGGGAAVAAVASSKDTPPPSASEDKQDEPDADDEADDDTAVEAEETGVNEEAAIAAAAVGAAAVVGGGAAVAAVAASSRQSTPVASRQATPTKEELEEEIAEDESPVLSDGEKAAIGAGAGVAAVGVVGAGVVATRVVTPRQVQLSQTRGAARCKLDRQKHGQGGIFAAEPLPTWRQINKSPRIERNRWDEGLILALPAADIDGGSSPESVRSAKTRFETGEAFAQKPPPEYMKSAGSLPRDKWKYGAILHLPPAQLVFDRDPRLPTAQKAQGGTIQDRIPTAHNMTGPARLTKSRYGKGAVLLLPGEEKKFPSPELTKKDYPTGAILVQQAADDIPEISPEIPKKQYAQGMIMIKHTEGEKTIENPQLHYKKWGQGAILVPPPKEHPAGANPSPELEKKNWAQGAVVALPEKDPRDQPQYKPMLTKNGYVNGALVRDPYDPEPYPYDSIKKVTVTRRSKPQGAIFSRLPPEEYERRPYPKPLPPDPYRASTPSNAIEPTDPAMFGEQPISMMCPYCSRKIQTKVDHTPGGKAFKCCCIASIFILPLLTCLSFIPLCMKKYNDIEHSCPKCLRIIAHKKK